jgi:hypothetical protein
MKIRQFFRCQTDGGERLSSVRQTDSALFHADSSLYFMVKITFPARFRYLSGPPQTAFHEPADRSGFIVPHPERSVK